MAFMFETFLPQQVTSWAAGIPELQQNYLACWQGLKRCFNPMER
jgi:homogentisate 1,2-dioxygenase